MEQNTHTTPREGEDRLVERFTPIIRGFIAKHILCGNSYIWTYGSFRYDVDDIFQGCMLTVLEKYRASTADPETFHIP